MKMRLILKLKYNTKYQHKLLFGLIFFLANQQQITSLHYNPNNHENHNNYNMNGRTGHSSPPRGCTLLK